jgi:hypothetical protein
MLSEMATKEAIYIVAGIDETEHKQLLEEAIVDYERTRQAVNDSPFFEAALSKKRGQAGAFAEGLLENLRIDWDEMRKQFAILNAGDAQNFDLDALLRQHAQFVGRIERFTAAMVRYANIAYAQ